MTRFRDPAAVDWIGLDWGTSRLRAWAFAPDGRVAAEAVSDRGAGTLARPEFEAALLTLVGDWLGERPVPAIACGMVGSRQGWVEAPYRPVPCPPLGGTPAIAPTRDPRLRVRVIPGLRQARPPDVMRGEETQIAGWLAARPGFDGVLCLPGTHTKWARLSAGEVVSFQTFMTGELFAAIAGHTVLRHSVGEGWDEAAFATAVEDGLARPERLAARLFAIRADDLLAGLAPATARARLSGLLIGAELAAARPYWLGQSVAIVGAPALAAAYAAALAALGVHAEVADGAAMTRAGLAAARAMAEAPA
jgi:2-dehydro-3-deoxygalactonokinase